MSDYILHNGRLYSADELYHHGVKGQQWGVRRYQNEDGSLTAEGRQRLKQDMSNRQTLVDEEYTRRIKEYDIEGKYKAAIEYGRKNELDLDDGGGGSEEAGRKYMRMMNEVEQLSAKAKTESEQYVRDRLIREYGKQTIEDFERSQNRASSAKIYTLTAGLVTGLVAGMIYLGVSSSK